MLHNKILGIHHITAIAGDPKRNYRFYTKVLGLRFLKKTVNFDDPYTYHFYFGDNAAAPGSILTFFPIPEVRKGSRGTAMATEIQYVVPRNSLEFWMNRLKEFGVVYNTISQKFDEEFVSFIDPDGLKFELSAVDSADSRTPFLIDGLTEEHAIRGFHGITLTLNNIKATADILTDIFGYTLVSQSVNRYRFETDAVPDAQVVELVELPAGSPGIVAGGTIHHVAFRVPDDAAQMYFREKIVAKGLNITPMIDRNYFHSLYFREPGGVLFEIATDTPGFYVDETDEQLGKNLMLPKQYEAEREKIEAFLQKID